MISKIFKYLKISILVSIPITLWILPAIFFDKGSSISIFALLDVGDYAYSTGMTKSIMHLMHFDFQGALKYNILSFIVLPLLFLLWLKLLLKEFNVKILKRF